MGSESSNSDSNSSRSDSDSSSNSGSANGTLEEMLCLAENKNTVIKRVWIVKKTISLGDMRVVNIYIPLLDSILPNFSVIAGAKGRPTPFFKHWAIILELSNGSFVNIQFGRNGFSLKEFNKTNIEGENILNAIKETWGEKNHPFSFCYLGNANYEYENLKTFLEKEKNKEAKKFEEEGKTYYNIFHYNCQHFACEIERILFNKIKTFHHFDYYLIEFFQTFFAENNVNII